MVQVRVRVRTRPYSEVKRVKEQIVVALNAFLDPRTGGPDGLGWPFGRDVYRSEILQVDAAFRDRHNPVAVCLDSGSSPCQERPLFICRRPEDVNFGPEVPLVQVAVSHGVIKGNLDLRLRRYARRLVRPHIGWGITEPGRSGCPI
jgi:hypothetical protein